MKFDWSRFHDEVEAGAPGILSTRTVPGPPAEPYAPGAAYPFAVDVNGRLGAIAYAILDPYPTIERGWWSLVMAFVQTDGVWPGGGAETDNTTSPRPFERRAESENCSVPGMDWLVHGTAGWGDEPTDGCFLGGYALTGTKRVTITASDGVERDLAITPWCGGFAAVVAGESWELTAYGADGEEIGSTAYADEDEPDADRP